MKWSVLTVAEPKVSATGVNSGIGLYVCLLVPITKHYLGIRNGDVEGTGINRPNRHWPRNKNRVFSRNKLCILFCFKPVGTNSYRPTDAETS